MTDFVIPKALQEDLGDFLDFVSHAGIDIYRAKDLLTRLRAAQPAPRSGPTREDLVKLFDGINYGFVGGTGRTLFECFADAVLALPAPRSGLTVEEVDKLVTTVSHGVYINGIYVGDGSGQGYLEEEEFAEDIRAALRAKLCGPEDGDGWQPIEMAIPYKDVLLSHPDGRMEKGQVRLRDGRIHTWPTHWRPLPKGPASDGGEA